MPKGRAVAYVGKRHKVDTGDPEWGTLEVFVEEEGGKKRRLRHVVHHSPSGMECSFAGSGPADLALSLLVDLLDERPARSGRRVRGERYVRAWSLHQEFKRDFVQGLPVEGWRLLARDVVDWVARAERESGETT